MQSGRNAFVAVLRLVGGRGQKAPRFTCRPATSARSPAAANGIQPLCSAANAHSYLKSFPKQFSRHVIYGSTNPWYCRNSAQLPISQRPFDPAFVPACAREYHDCAPYGTSADGAAVDAANGPSTGASDNLDGTAGKKAMPPKRVNVVSLNAMYRDNIPITMVTAYDTHSARVASDSGVEMILVGDSVGMVVLGHPNTVAVTMDQMVHHCKAVTSARPIRSMVVGDMPFGSYLTPTEALHNATRLLKEGAVDAVKLEGGKNVAPIVKELVRAGVVVVGHIGLCPQMVAATGGFRMQGKTVEAARELLEDARALEAAGCTAIVIELVPSEVADYITRNVGVPTIGIGCGSSTSGQVLVWHDLLGMYPSPPKFSRQFAKVGEIMTDAVSSYVASVRQRSFPAESHTTHLEPALANQLRHECEDAEEAHLPSTPSPLPAPASLPTACPDRPHKNALSADLSRVLVVGGGSLGTLFAGRLAAAEAAEAAGTVGAEGRRPGLLSGYGEHVARIRDRGLVVSLAQQSPQPGELCLPASAVQLLSADRSAAQSGDRGKFGAALFVTSGTQTRQRALDAKQYLADDYIVLTLQNGFGNEDELKDVFDPERVMVGVTNQGAYLEGPGHVVHTGTTGETILLPCNQLQRDAAAATADLLRRAGFPTRVVTDPGQALLLRWKKVAVNAVINPLTSLLAVRNGEIVECEQLRDIVREVAREIACVAAKADGVKLDEEALVEEVMRVGTATKLNVSSMLRCTLQGRRPETKQISGAIASRGMKYGIRTPYNALLAQLVEAKVAASEQQRPFRLAGRSRSMRHYSTASIRVGGDSSMRVCDSLAKFHAFRTSLPSDAKIGFVPTMGALHDGHLSLLAHARQSCDAVVCSVFVNPLQFDNPTDLALYPRTADSDSLLLSRSGLVDAVFFPSVDDLYPSSPDQAVRIHVAGMDSHGEGKFRTGHFDGVATVCTILFNLVRPTDVFFGQKDGMQCILIRKLVSGLHLPHTVHIVPTSRANDGLALSSRNARLTPEQRLHAPRIYQALRSIERAAADRTGNPLTVGDATALFNKDLADAAPVLVPDYLCFTDWSTGVPVADADAALPLHGGATLVSTAVRAGQTRLLDNIILS